MFARKSDQPSVTEETVLRALSTVMEPELHRDLVSLNMIRNLKISGNDVAFTIMLTTPACPVKDQMKAQAEALAEAALEVALGDLAGLEAAQQRQRLRVRAEEVPDRVRLESLRPAERREAVPDRRGQDPAEVEEDGLDPSFICLARHGAGG